MGNTRGWTGQNPTPGNILQGTTGNTDIVLNQAWIFGEKSINKYSCGWDWGWRVDFGYGSDMPGWQTYNDIGDLVPSNHHNTQSFDYGWLTGGGGTSVMYGAAMPQLYATLKYNRLSAKIGRFLSPMGYESIMAPADRNYFYSHSYSFNYFSPHTMTGVMGEFAANRQLSLLLGWTNGWNCGPSFNSRGGSMVNGGFQYRPNKCFELSYMFSAGDVFNQNDNVFGGLKPHGYFHSILADWKVTHRLRLGLETTYANFDTNNAFYSANLGNAKWWTLANYLSYDLNRCWSTALRFEYVDMDNLFYSFNPFMFGGFSVPPSNLYSLTWGVTWKPGASRHLAVRPELRYDWFNAGGRTTDLLSGGLGVTYVF